MISLAPFKEYISEVCGLRFDDCNGSEKLGLALTERMQATGLAEPGRYLERITADQDEFQCLVNLLTINETYFFREPQQLRLLTEQLMPRFLIRYDGQAPVRILSAGCSSGEEPYSLAMSLRERYGESLPRFCSFSGVDIDSTVLAKARNGRYGEFSFRGVSPEIRARYFEKTAAGWQVQQDIRSLVSFQELNLLAREMPHDIGGFDIIFFRNVSIYFDEPTRRQIQQNLSSLMKADGILIVGCAETIANDLGVFEMVEEEGLFYFIKGSPPLPEQRALPGSSKGQKAVAQVSQQQTPDLPLPVLTLPEGWKTAPAVLQSIDDISRLIQGKQYDQALLQLEARLQVDPSEQAALLLKALIMLNRKQLDRTQSLARQVLEKDPWSVDAFLLLGLAAKWNEQPDEAVTWFKQAAYACHTCWPAHYYLADLYSRSGGSDLARRAYRTTLQQLVNSTVETGIQVVPLGLPVAEIRLLCEHQLTKLDRSATG